MFGNDKESPDNALGVVLLISATLAIMVIETVARHNCLASTNYNSTIPSMGHGTLSASMDFYWMVVPFFLHCLSSSMIGVAGIKLIASQAPYSMRGLIMVSA